MIQIGYSRYKYDFFVYYRVFEDDSYIFLMLYVDNMLVAIKNINKVDRLKLLLSIKFDMKDQEQLRRFFAWRSVKIERPKNYGYLRKII